ncbi:MAG: hypothetical protein F6K34_11470, partial [Okeania sp. SIO4D6]|nr:hypothetical protein [Okeania sp. SIO4D6]
MATTIIDDLSTSRGVFVDDQNNIFVYDFDYQPFSGFVNSVKKFDENGSLLDTVSIGEGDPLSAKFAELPNSDSFIGLREDGMLMLIDPDPLSVDFLDNLHLRSLEDIETSPFYHITLNDVIDDANFDPGIWLPYSNYNDIAVRQNGDFLDLFITGEYEFVEQLVYGDGGPPTSSLIGFRGNNYDFVMRVEVSSDLANVIEAQLLMVGEYAMPFCPFPPSDELPIPFNRTGPGIAVNTEGTVLTALPTFVGDSGYFAYPDLVAFPADFEPTDILDDDSSNNPGILLDGLGIDSFGMTADDAGNFYVLDSKVTPNSTSVIVFPPTFGQRSSEEVLGISPTLPLGDIAVDFMNQKAYVTFQQESPGSYYVPEVVSTVMTFDAGPEPELELPPELIYVLPHITY